MSPRQDWETPPNLFNALNKRFDFTLDVCANKENAKCERYYTEADNGLEQPWTGRIWCNPPYEDIEPWAKRARAAQLDGYVVVMLLPVRPGQAWFQDYVAPFADIRWCRGRIAFVGSKSSPAWDSMIAIYWPRLRAVRGDLSPEVAL